MIPRRTAARPNGARTNTRQTEDGETEDGWTVLELMISMVVMLVVMATLLEALTSMSKADIRTQALANNTDTVRFLAVRVARDIRAANPLLASDPVTGHTVSANEIIVTSGPTTGPQTVVAWRYDPTAHTLSRCSRALAATTVSCDTVLTGVNVSNSAPVFQYFCTSGALLNPAAANGPADIASAGARVRVTLEAAPQTGPAALPIQEDAQLRDRSGATGC